MWSHPTWCLMVVTLSVIVVTGSKVPRQIVYQIRPAPSSAFDSPDGRFLLDDGVTEFQFPSYGLKTQESRSLKSGAGSVLGLAGNNDSGDVDVSTSSSSSASSSSSSSPSEEGSSAATKEEISEAQPKFNNQVKQVNRQQFLQLQPEQIEQILNSYNPQVQQLQQQQQQQLHDQKQQLVQLQQAQQQQQQQQQQLLQNVGPRYEYKSIEETANTSADDIKTAQTRVITEENLQSAYSERREKRRRNKGQQQQEPPGDASYAFGYETDEAARHEVADADGTVKGWYTYVDDEGTVRKIIYTAGAGKGFVVLGKEKIKGPGASSSPPQQQQRRKYNNKGSNNNRVNTDYGYAADSSTISSLKHQKPQTTASTSFANFNFNNWNDLAKAGTSNPPAPTTITAEAPQRTKKPVFVVKIRRPVHKDQSPEDSLINHQTRKNPYQKLLHSKNRIMRGLGSKKQQLSMYNLEMAGDSSSSLLLLPPPSKYLAVNGKQANNVNSNSNNNRHLLSDPEPLSFPVTTTSLKNSNQMTAPRTRRRPTMTLSDVVPGLRKSRIKKYPTPPIYYTDASNDDDESGGYDDGSSSQGSASSSSEYDDSGEGNNGNYGGGGGGGNNKGGGSSLPVDNNSYTFGYETDTANRLEKADPYGNVRGSYSYIGSSQINQLLSRQHNRLKEQQKFKRSPRKSKKSLKFLDPEGVKRTVHYIAGGNTGFQVIHASPSISRGVRLEAPPGYVVKRVPSLRAAESRYPIPITVPQPSAIVYHIHPDSGWKPWEPTLRKKKVKIHRKKIPKEFFENARRDGIVLLQTHPEPKPVTASRQQHTNLNMGASSGSSVSITAPGNGNTYFKEKVTAAGSGAVTATETQIPHLSPMSPPISRRRHAPQRGFTAERHVVEIDDDGSPEYVAATLHHHQQKSKSSSSSSQSSSGSSSSSAPAPNSVSEAPVTGPGLYSPAPFESMREAVNTNGNNNNNRIPVAPNPIQLQPTQVAIKSRGAPGVNSAVAAAAGGGGGLDTSSSNHHPVAFTSDGKLQVDVPTVIIEAIEAKSPSSLAMTATQKDEPQNNKNTVSVPSSQHHHHHHHHHNKLPEAAALQQSSAAAGASASIASSSVSSNLIKAPTPTTSSPTATYELVSASSVAYQKQPSAPTAPSASAASKAYTPILANSNNVINNHHHQHQQQHSTSSVQQQQQHQQGAVISSTAPPPIRSRRRHHKSKNAATTTPTSPSSFVSSASSSSSITSNSISSSSSSSSSNAIRAVASGNLETTTAMSSSKRLINRLAATDNESTAAAQQ